MNKINHKILQNQPASQTKLCSNNKEATDSSVAIRANWKPEERASKHLRMVHATIN